MRIEVEGLEELRARFSQFPRQFNAALRSTLDDSLLVLWENVPSYPTIGESSYIRTGTLGRSLGSSEHGGKSGGEKPSIYHVEKQGMKVMAASFGTNLEYAPYVIGEKEQARVHQGRWWTIEKIGQLSKAKIQQLFEGMARQLAQWLDGKRL